MSFRTFLSIAAAVCVVAPQAWAQVKYQPGQVSVLPGIGTAGAQAEDYSFGFSLNIFAGTVGGVHGFEAGTILNTVRGSVSGFQGAGILNIVHGSVSGFQGAGIGNITKGRVEGFQGAGIFSMASSVDGFQGAGVVANAGSVSGAQAAGLVALSSGPHVDMQAAGVVSIAHSADVQLAGTVNIARSIHGVQIGSLFNKTNTLRGLQIGLINTADTVSGGLQIGLISLSPANTFNEVEIGGADYSAAQISYKHGRRQFYNIYSVGNTLWQQNMWVAGLGFGLTTTLAGGLEFQPELVYYTYLPEDFKDIRYTSATHLKARLSYMITSQIGLSVAPGLYVGNEDIEGNSKGYPINRIKPFYTHRGTNSITTIGLGLQAGLLFRF